MRLKRKRTTSGKSGCRGCTGRGLMEEDEVEEGNEEEEEEEKEEEKVVVENEMDEEEEREEEEEKVEGGEVAADNWKGDNLRALEESKSEEKMKEKKKKKKVRKKERVDHPEQAVYTYKGPMYKHIHTCLCTCV